MQPNRGTRRRARGNRRVVSPPHDCTASPSGLDGHPDEMLHEDLQGDIVRDDHGGVATGSSEAAGASVVGVRRVHLGRQEASLRAARVRLDKLGHGEPIAKDHLRVLGWGLEECLEVRVLLLLLIARLVPGLDGLTAPDDHVEEGVQEKDDIRLQRIGVQQHGLRRPLVEGVLQQRRLDHDEGVHGVLPEDDRAVEGRLIRTGVEGLQEVAAPKVVHELREDREFRRKVKGLRLVLAVVRELGYQADQHPVHPAQHVERVLVLTLEDGVPRHQHCGRLLVKACGDVAHGRIGVPVGDRGDAQTLAARRVQVARLELQEGLLPLRHGVRLLVRDVEVEGDGGVLVERADDPLARLTLANLGLGHRRALLAQR
mmetsp:Transcript_42002/g.124634  ORF Transcript_42002/g.124634 Transcript_42002/m.124634 type:complete len:371 (+) Transcript_42002:56-1168(+)